MNLLIRLPCDKLQIVSIVKPMVLLFLFTVQGVSTMWKGFGSVFVTKGIFMVSETVISEVTPLPK